MRARHARAEQRDGGASTPRSRAASSRAAVATGTTAGLGETAGAAGAPMSRKARAASLMSSAADSGVRRDLRPGRGRSSRSATPAARVQAASASRGCAPGRRAACRPGTRRASRPGRRHPPAGAARPSATPPGRCRGSARGPPGRWPARARSPRASRPPRARLCTTTFSGRTSPCVRPAPMGGVEGVGDLAEQPDRPHRGDLPGEQAAQAHALHLGGRQPQALGRLAEPEDPGKGCGRSAPRAARRCVANRSAPLPPAGCRQQHAGSRRSRPAPRRGRPRRPRRCLSTSTIRCPAITAPGSGAVRVSTPGGQLLGVEEGSARIRLGLRGGCGAAQARAPARA